MRRLLLLPLLLLLVLPAQAQAAAPCRDRIFNDWYADGKIASTYPHVCYVDALHHIPRDADVYSNLREDITAAMRAGLELSAGKAVPRQVGHGFTSQNVLASSHTTSVAQPRSAPHDPAPSTVSSSSSSSSSSPTPSEQSASGGVVAAGSGTPLPVLTLGALALVLVAAGAIGAGVKHARSRRR